MNRSKSDGGAAAPRRYKDDSRQKVYEACLALAADPTSELYRKDGSPRGGANVRIAFWSGFKGANREPQIPAGTMLEAAYMAGKQWAKARKALGSVPLPGAAAPELPGESTVKAPGGFREGAGAKALFGAAMQRKQVLLDEASIKEAERLGDGNLSAGIREALRRSAGVAPVVPQYS